MARSISVRGVRRKEVDEDKLALAFLMLAKVLHEQEHATSEDVTSPPPLADPEAV